MMLLGTGCSGASYKAKFPQDDNSNPDLTCIITKKVLEDSGAILDISDNDVRELLKRLKTYFEAFQQSQLNENYRRPVNYEDLYYMAHQVFYNGDKYGQNPGTWPFIEQVKIWCSDLMSPSSGDEDPDSTPATLTGRVLPYIQARVKQTLAPTGGVSPEGLNLVLELAKSNKVERLDICTLNHDLLIENLPGNDICDGFDNTPTNGSYHGRDCKFRPYNPKLFEETCAKVRLFKLHGSINWASLDTPNNYTAKPVGIVQDPKQLPQYPEVMTGTGNKSDDKSSGSPYVFADMWCWFHRLLMEHDVLVMSGTSLGDYDVYGQLWAWKHRDNKNKLIGLYANNHGSERVKECLKEPNGFCTGKWLSETTLKELFEQIEKAKA
ncbi:MAG: hypothetical protein JW909_05180 [Planctomycetes bacterium]|nr:hypothetical protein [Planctomycetota bacterium]